MHRMLEFDTNTDLLLILKITNIVFKVKEQHHAMYKANHKSDRQRTFGNVIQNKVRFLLMTMKIQNHVLSMVVKT